MTAPGKAPRRIWRSILAAPGFSQSLVSTSQSTSRWWFAAATAATAAFVSRYGGRKHFDFTPLKISCRIRSGGSWVSCG